MAIETWIATWTCVALIVAALYLGWSRRFLASGAILVVNVAIFVITEYLARGAFLELAFFTPDLLNLHPRVALTTITSMFLHGGVMHLIGNTITLLIFGLLFEERVGHRRFILIYLITGIAGTLLQGGFGVWDLQAFIAAECQGVGQGDCLRQYALAGNPLFMVGASGAIMGVLGAFAGAFPTAIVPVPVPLLVFFIFVRMRVWIGASILAAFNFILLLASQNNPGDNVGYLAHLGGLAMGLLLGFVWLRRTAEPEAKRLKIDPSHFGQFAQDEGTRRAHEQIMANRDEPEVLTAWMERFFTTAKCPTCEHAVMPDGKGSVVCTHGHRFDVRQDKSQPQPS